MINARRLLDESLKRHVEEAGPEPTIIPWSPKIAEQVKRWEAWWWDWYRKPL